MDYLFLAPQQGFKCIVKNTFLDIVDTDQPELAFGARNRSCSEGRLHEMRRELSLRNHDQVVHSNFDVMSNMKTFTPPSILPSTDGGESPLDTVSSTRTGSPQPSETSICDHQTDLASSNAGERQGKLPVQILEMLFEELTDLVEEHKLTREDMLKYEVTEQLCPYIPVDEEDQKMSLGSMWHLSGACKPCAFLKRDRCHKRDLCLFCHFTHEDFEPKKKTVSRKSKSTRKRASRQMQMEQCKE
jgi:hypothetical protein